jgi:PPE-repeat protein
MTKSRFRNTVLGIGATAAAIAFGYFGVQYIGKNNMFTIAAAVGGAGAISYVLQKPNQPQAPSSQPEAPATPMKTQRRRNKL